MKRSRFAFFLILFGSMLCATHAMAELNLECEVVLNGPESVKSPLQDRIAILTNKIRSLAGTTDKILIQYEIFKVVQSEFKGLVGDAQNALAYFHEKDGANDFTPEIAGINSNAQQIQKNVSSLQKVLKPGFWSRIFAISAEGRKEAIDKLSLKIQSCGSANLVCSESIVKKSASLAKHISNVRRLAKDVEESSKVLEGSLSYLEKLNMSADDKTALTVATSGVFNELKMTQALLAAHLVQIENEVKSANASLETIQTLRPMLAGVVGLGAPAYILEGKKVAQSTGQSGAASTGDPAKEIVGLLEMSPRTLAEAIKQFFPPAGSGQLHASYYQSYLDRLAEITDETSSKELASLIVYTGLEDKISAILETRSHSEQMFTAALELGARPQEIRKAFAMLSTVPTEAATSKMIEIIANEKYLLRYPFISSAFKRRHYGNVHVGSLAALTVKGQQEDWTRAPWIAAEALESVGTQEALATMESIYSRFQNSNTNDGLIKGFPLELSMRIDRIRLKLENPEIEGEK
jgi:hypothetical protein